MSIDSKRARAIQSRGLHRFIRWLGSSSPGAAVFAAPGVSAAVVPATPQRSVMNSVAYDSVEGLDGALQKLTTAYERAGVAAWTVWAPEDDAEAIALLTDAGHVFDGSPAAMVCELAKLEAPDPGNLDWDAEGELAELGRLNDLAYGFEDGQGYAPAFAEPSPQVPTRLYRARVRGKVATVLFTLDSEDDTEISFVATPERYRGRGLATRLMAVALVEARERGQLIASLQASPLGEPVYAALGFETHFRWHLYERRAQPQGQPRQPDA